MFDLPVKFPSIRVYKKEKRFESNMLTGRVLHTHSFNQSLHGCGCQICRKGAMGNERSPGKTKNEHVPRKLANLTGSIPIRLNFDG